MFLKNRNKSGVLGTKGTEIGTNRVLLGTKSAYIGTNRNNPNSESFHLFVGSLN